MKLPNKTIKAASYVSGIFVIASSGLLVILLALSIAGLIHPRGTEITLYTEDISKIYDGTPLGCSVPELYHSSLLEDHRLVIREYPNMTFVGEMRNAPVYRILDDTGADVTAQYDITEKFGTLSIHPRPITLSTLSKTQRYTGQSLSADEPILSFGSLASGQELVFGDSNTLIFPGTVQNKYNYRIEDEDGIDRSNQYEITENFGDLSVLPITLYLSTESAKKTYDGNPLYADGWKLESGSLMDGHSLSAKTVSVIQDVGSCDNELCATVTDANGANVSHLYEFKVFAGRLEILPIHLIITTGSAVKIYDGEPLSCNDWALTSGDLDPGHTIVPSVPFIYNGVGEAENAIRFQIFDSDGNDHTSRYNISYIYGTLNIQPRPLTIRTGSAEKVHDGDVLTCNDFTILNGSLCPKDRIYLDCVSFWGVGYSDNLVLSCVIMREENGIQTDVTNCYRIAFQYGVLRITPN